MAGEFFKQFRALSTDWMIGAFVGATLDFFFSMVHTKSHILNTISALLQFTCGTFIVHEFLYSVGQRKGNNTLQGTWILMLSLWWMSPKAVQKLQGTYYAFHRLLYGTKALVPEVPAPELKTESKCNQ